MVNFEHVLYTPLDIPDPPEYDAEKLIHWLNTPFERQQIIQNYISNKQWDSKHIFGDNYLWDLKYPFFNYFNENFKWDKSFVKEFPQIKEYVLDSFYLSEEELGAFVLLPMRKDKVGMGFWHQDIDVTGIRWYLDFESYETDNIMVKSCKERYTPTSPHPFKVPYSEETLKHYFNPEQTCRVMKRNQAFYLNNYSGIHATYTAEESVGKPRIASFIVPNAINTSNYLSRIMPLVMRSAEKFKDYAVLDNG